MKVKYFKTLLIASAFAIALSGCSQSEPAMPEKEGDGSRTEIDNRDYDTRFPVPVWTDDEGVMHLDMDLNDYEAPTKDKLMANLCGHGWELGKFYKFDAFSDGTFRYYESDAIGDVAGCDPHLRYFIEDNSYTCYYIQTMDADGNIVPEEDSHKSDTEAFNYNETTGVLDLHVLIYWRVVSITENELWLAGKGDVSGVDIEWFGLVKMVRVSDEQVAKWNATFRPL